MKKIVIVLVLIFGFFSCKNSKENKTPEVQSYKIPHLVKKGIRTQLVVENQPFLILGGELGNSTASSMESMEVVWPKLKAMNLNTVLVPIYWELFELEEGKFDYKLIDDLIEEARNQDLKIIFLWFASWKNSMSSHVPSWVKNDDVRFPRVKDDNGISQEILTPLSENNLQADLVAFEALMTHIKMVDEYEQTVIMMQPENEIGMLPVARDYSDLANQKFNEEVPEAFINYLVENKEKLVPEFYSVWEENGFKTSGNWEAIFGKGTHTDEIFMAWYFAQYTNKIIEAGKEIYPLPMFVNAALNRPNREPGKGYPSAGPLPHIMDVWFAGGKSIGFLAPDFYFPNIKHWSDLYTRQENPLFIPEHRFDNTVGPKALFTIGHYESLGFSPFSIESKEDSENEPLGKAYHLINQLSPFISSLKGTHKMNGVLLDKANPETKITLGDYEFTFRHSHTLGWEAASKNDVWEDAGALIIQTKDNEFFVAGTGIVVTFKSVTNPSTNVGILKVDKGEFKNNEWKVIRHLNGDQTHQGRHLRIFHGDYEIQRLELYTYN